MYYDPQYRNTVKTEPWRVVLRHAADSIERVGWCQHREYETEGDRMTGICAEYAIHCASLKYVGSMEARYRFIKYLDHSISDWNDLPSQKKENVVAALRACADAT